LLAVTVGLRPVPPLRSLLMTDKVYSKAQVDAAGRMWTDYLALPSDERDALRTEDPDFLHDLIAADEVIEWWRRQHAYPLSKVNAGLRHYLNPYGRPSVTQRLKKWPTIIYKLQRHSTMRLSAMQDVGGLRAILPNQTAVDEITGRLRRIGGAGSWPSTTTYGSPRRAATARST
jgi:hypothetical protein